MSKRVMVSGCFDLLHSGHVEFFRQAAQFGDLYVAIGSDQTVFDLKGRLPVNNQEERLYLVKAISYVKDAFISRGSGILDFALELEEIRPDYLVVNEDGNIPAKAKLCEKLGIEYTILKRDPYQGLAPRSTTDLRKVNNFPYRIDLAGGWLDQPYVSQYYPGSVVTISIEPTIEFNERSGMATSTRRKAIDLWGPRLPGGDPEKLAKILFCYDNPPGTKIISGSQDAIGLCMPGINKAYYEGEYWPVQIEKIRDELTYQFIEESLYLIPLGPRDSGFSVLDDTDITVQKAKALADAADGCWSAILDKDLRAFGKAIRAGFEAQVAMFPHMMTEPMRELIGYYMEQVLGWKVSGAGGGGYLILVSEKTVENAMKIVIRRELS